MNNNLGLAEKIVEVFFVSIFSILICINVSIFFSLSFKITSYLSVFILFFLFLIIFLKNKYYKNFKHILSFDNFFLIFICISVGLIIASINRYSGDDGAYYAKAVYYTNFPNTILDNSIPWVAGLTENSETLTHLNFETFLAIFAWLMGVNFLTIAHSTFPILLGSIFFLSIYLLISTFTENKINTIYLTIIIILLYFLLAETSRSHGVYALSRIHQGKSIVIFIGLYIWVYFSLKFFLEQKLKHAINLLIISFTLSEISTTSLVFTPILSIIIFFSYNFSIKNLNLKKIIKSGLIYFFCFSPLIFNALKYKFIIDKKLNITNLNDKFSTEFFDQLFLVFDENLWIIYTFLVSLILLSILFSKNKNQSFYFYWIVLSFVFILNPFVSKYIIKYISSSTIYWRLLFILPFPFVLTFLFEKVFKIYESKFINLNIFCCIVAILMCLINYSPFSLINNNDVRFKVFSYKLTPVSQLVVDRFSNFYNPGTMLSDPKWYTVAFVLLSSDYPQYFWEPQQMLSFNNENEWKKKVNVRKSAMQYLYGKKFGDKRDYFVKFLENNCPDYILQNIDHRMNNIKEAEKIIKKFGYKIGENSKNIHPDLIVWESNCKR